MNRLLQSTYQFLNKQRKIFAITLIALFGILVFGVSKIQLQEDVSNILPSSEKDAQVNKIIQSTSFLDQIVFKVTIDELESKEELSEFATVWLDKVDSVCGEKIEQIQGKIDAENLSLLSDFIFDNLPLFLNESDYTNWTNQLTKDSVNTLLTQHLKTLTTPAGFINKDNIRKDPFNLLSRTFQKFGHARLESDLILENGFLMSPDKKNILLFITLKGSSMDTEGNEQTLQNLQEINNQLNEEYQGKVIGSYYGAPFIAAANAHQIKSDIQSTVSISFSVLILLLLLFFKKVWVPIVLFIPTIFGALIALNFLVIFREDVSGISLGIGSILLGISLDYSLHVLTHLRQGHSAESIFTTIASPLLVSALTTTGAFFCLLFLPSQALQDLGLFAGISVLFTSVASLLIIPVLYKSKADVDNNVLNKIARFVLPNKAPIVLFLGVIIVLSSLFYDKVDFESDLAKMNYLSPELEQVQGELNEILSIDEKSVYVVAFDSNLNTALLENERVFEQLIVLEQSKKIQRFTSIGQIVLDEGVQQEKLKTWNNFVTNKNDSIQTLLKVEGLKIGFKESTFTPFYSISSTEFTPTTIDEYDTLKSVLNLDNFINYKNGIYTVLNTIKLDEGQTELFKQTFKTSEHSVIIDRKEINENLIHGLKENFSELINYSFLVVVLIVFVYFKRIEITFITLLPIALTWGLTLSLMYLFNIQFTVFNIIISSFIFGLGVDYSIMMSNALIQNYTKPSTIVRDTKVAILLSVLTTLLGIGALILAKHPALASISIVCLIGILSCVFITFTIQPWLFNLMIGNRPNKGKRPIRIHIWFISIFLLFYFAFGAFLFSLLSISILQLVPIKGSKKRLLLHKITSWHLKNVVSGHPFVKNKVINPTNESFNKPAIIIANHSSSLDNLYLALLSNKLIYLVKDWVMKSPIFGIAVKQMGYIPVTEDFDGNIEKLKSRVERGYSIVVFPEGKRSNNAGINRFHKGAFFLQQELELDILPVHLLGASDTMKKGNFMIQSNEVKLVVEPRIPYLKEDFEQGLSKRTKVISAHYKLRHHDLILEHQKLAYVSRLILDNFRFKSTEVFNEISNELKNSPIDFDLLEENLVFGKSLTLLNCESKILPIYLSERDPKRKLFYATNNPNCWMDSCFSLQNKNFKKVSQDDIFSLSSNVILLEEFEETLHSKIAEHFGTIIVLKNGENLNLQIEGFTSKQVNHLTIFTKNG